jgi:hypothetical protein
VVHDFSQGLLNDLLATRQDDADKEWHSTRIRWKAKKQ